MTKRTTQAERAARRRKLMELRRAGQSQYDIAQELGVSRSLVQKELRALGAAAAPEGRVRAPRAVSLVKNTASGISTDLSGLSTIMPPPDHLGRWKRLDLDRDTFGRSDPAELISLIINISPEASRAVWDWLRLLNAGHEITAYKPGTDEVDERAQELLGDFISKLEEYHGSFKTLAGRVFMSALTRGAFFAELVLDEAGRVPLDIATPDPATVRFKVKDVPERGRVWVPGQWQSGRFVTFDVPTVVYMALDPEPDSPYGRPMVAPAVFPTVFLIGVLHDLRRVISQQGYPRTDVVVKLEKLREAFGSLDDTKFEKMVDELIASIRRDMAGMEPDDQYVHTDAVEVNRASGAVDSSVMNGAAAIIEVLERMATRALKSMPLLMGSVDGAGDANSNRQWEVYAAGSRTLQHYAESMFGRLFGLSLQVQGVVADVRVRFAEIRAAEELRDAQTYIAKLRGAELAERLGYETPDSAAELATGHGIPEELRDEREGLMGTQTGGSGSATSATQVDGNEHGSAGDRATMLPAMTPERVNAALQTWRNHFAGEPEASLLDAEVVGGDE